MKRPLPIKIITSPNGVDLKFVTSLVNYKAKFFFSNSRWRVVGDEKFVSLLLQDEKWTELEFMESFYRELVETNKNADRRTKMKTNSLDEEYD